MFFIEPDHAGGLTEPLYDSAGNLMGGRDGHTSYGDPIDEPATGPGLLSAILGNPVVSAALAAMAWAMGTSRH